MTPDTLLFRQVNPNWVREGRVTSQLFTPTKKDQKRPSVYDGDQTSAEDSWRHYTEKLKFSSIGVMAVTVAECEEQNLPIVPDPEPFPEHVIIKFDDCSNSQIEKKAKKLTRTAEARGWQYRAKKD